MWFLMNIAKRVVVKKHYFVTCLKGCFIFFTFAILIEQDCQSFSHHECTFTNITKSRYNVLIDVLCITFCRNKTKKSSVNQINAHKWLTTLRLRHINEICFKSSYNFQIFVIQLFFLEYPLLSRWYSFYNIQFYIK